MKQHLLVSVIVMAMVCHLAGTIFAQKTPPANKTFNPAGEVNAVWVATVSNLNWPSKPGLTVEQQKQEAIAILEQSKAIGLNMIVLQVRPTGDAFYKSDFFPWSKNLTGTQGKDPGYDPLQFWVEESHKRGLAVHAWINPYRLSNSGGGEKADLSLFSNDHPAHMHPDWVVAYADNKMYFNPGIPECRKYVVDAGLEIAKKYDVDGLHMDDYFYPYPATKTEADGSKSPAMFGDADAFAKYGPEFVREAKLTDKSEKEQLDHWRRHNVNLMIKELHDGVKKINPNVQFGVSPFGIWRNKSTDQTGSETSGMQSYDAIYADTKYWVEQGDVDYIVPQLYWNIGFQVADYVKLSDWWSQLVSKNPEVKLYIGLAAHRVGGKEGTAWENADEIVRQVKMNRAAQAISGQFYFGWPRIAKNTAGLADKIAELNYKKGNSEKSQYYFKNETVSVYLSPSLQPKNIGFGVYGTEENRMHEMSKYVEKVLVEHGVTIYQNKIGMTLAEAIDDSNAKKPSIHVALHSNAFKKVTRGTETYYRASGTHFEESKRLATRLYEGILKIYDGPRRGAKSTDSLREPRTTTSPSTLIEVAFHDNDVDSTWILDNMPLIGENIANSILLHLAEEHPDDLKK